jgi:hypothetical protein
MPVRRKSVLKIQIIRYFGPTIFVLITINEEQSAFYRSPDFLANH